MAENQEKNLAVIRHWLNIINENNTEKMIREWGEIASTDYLLHDPSEPDLKPGLAAYLSLFEQQMSAVADRKATLDDIFAVDDKVVLRGVYEFLDLASQERIRKAFIVISLFEGGKIKEEWQVIAPLAAVIQ